MGRVTNALAAPFRTRRGIFQFVLYGFISFLAYPLPWWRWALILAAVIVISVSNYKQGLEE